MICHKCQGIKKVSWNHWWNPGCKSLASTQFSELGIKKDGNTSTLDKVDID